MPKLSTKQKEKKLRAAAEKLRVVFGGTTFSSKEDVANWMRERSSALEKEGFDPADIFQILKIVTERML